MERVAVALCWLNLLHRFASVCGFCCGHVGVNVASLSSMVLFVGIPLVFTSPKLCSKIGWYTWFHMVKDLKQKMLHTHEMDNIQYDLTHVKKILHQQLVMVYCGGEGRNNFLLLLLRKQKHWHSQKNHFC